MMQSEQPTNLSVPSHGAVAHQMVALCAGVLPVWGRQLAASRAQSEVAVTDMLKAFADIGPHIDMASRQSEQINDALSHPLPMGGVIGLMDACEQVLAPVLQEPGLSAQAKAAVNDVLQIVRRAVGALEQVGRPFQHETQMVAEQVDRMYMGFQYQDRISQMMALLEGNIERLQNALSSPDGQAPDLSAWLEQLESQYAMAEQREVHQDTPDSTLNANNPNETTFF